MLPKVQSYQGFTSYGEIAYASLKPGIYDEKQKENIWFSTKRKIDHMGFYENFNYKNSVYDKQIVQNIDQDQFKKYEKVKNKNYKPILSQEEQEEQYQKANEKFRQTLKLSDKDNFLLKTGVENWKSTYTADIQNFNLKDVKAKRPDWTYYQKSYQVDSRVGPTEYNKMFGEFGHNPRVLINQNNRNETKFENELRWGTTKDVHHIPGYCGFIPASKIQYIAKQQGSGINPRTTFIKQNILENYLTKVPSYSGYCPKDVKNQIGTIRQYCFSTQGESFK